MSDECTNMMSPEEALRSLDQPNISLSGINDASDEYRQQRYGFKVHGMGFLVSTGTLCEVIKNFKVYPVPNTMAWIRGLVNLRGNLVPVFDLALLLETSAGPMNHDNLLVVDSGQDSVGILIDGLPVPCDTSKWPALPYIPELPASLNNSVTNAYSIDDVLWLCFDHQMFFRNAICEVEL